MLDILQVLQLLHSEIRVGFLPQSGEDIPDRMLMFFFTYLETVPWDVSDYVSSLLSPGRSQTQEIPEAALSSAFPPGPQLPGRIDEPATIVDIKGNILVWCLQDVLSHSAKVNFTQFTCRSQ